MTRSGNAIVLPPCALEGQLTEARELLKKKQLEAAWNATVAAMLSRPFHPEASLLLAEIAQVAGDSVSARRCAQHARNIAPGMETPPGRGNFSRAICAAIKSTHGLTMPEAIR